MLTGKDNNTNIPEISEAIIALSEDVQRFIDFADPKRNSRGDADFPQAAVYVEGVGEVSDLICEGRDQRSGLQRENVQRRREGGMLPGPWVDHALPTLRLFGEQSGLFLLSADFEIL